MWLCAHNTRWIEFEFILGKDLAGGQVFFQPIVIENPEEVGDVPQKFRDVFPACVITRAQAHSNVVNLSD